MVSVEVVKKQLLSQAKKVYEQLEEVEEKLRVKIKTQCVDPFIQIAESVFKIKFVDFDSEKL